MYPPYMERWRHTELTSSLSTILVLVSTGLQSRESNFGQFAERHQMVLNL